MFKNPLGKRNQSNVQKLQNWSVQASLTMSHYVGREEGNVGHCDLENNNKSNQNGLTLQFP